MENASLRVTTKKMTNFHFGGKSKVLLRLATAGFDFFLFFDKAQKRTPMEQMAL